MKKLQPLQSFKLIAIIFHHQQMLTSMNVYIDYLEINNAIYIVKVIVLRNSQNIFQIIFDEHQTDVLLSG